MRALVCVACRCELDRMEVGQGRAIVICLACEAIGHADEIALGARLIGIGDEAPRRSPDARRRASLRKPARPAPSEIR